ncbi:MAG: sigma-70 family RNA polymerase sigma factor [Saprospiraceae bacterium]
MQKGDHYQSDRNRAEACAKGDRQAQRILFEQVKNAMFGVCLRFCDNRSDAEDLLQEGFIRVFNSIANYCGKGSLEAWIRTIFVRTGIEYYHRQKKRPEIIDFEMVDIATNELPDDFDPYDPDSVLALLQKLPPGFRTVLNLAVLEEKSHEEIGRELGISASTSRSQLTRAKEFLRKIIQKTLVFI